MKFIKRSRREKPRVTLILLDWSVRESFHLLHYLSRQDVPRDSFEVMVIEYYSRTSDALRKFEAEVDTWLLLEMPEECYYHKHLMYNAGIAIARGEICVICDSDAMVKPGFIRTIVEAFDRDPLQVLHIDQFRNNRRDLYPFNYPTFEEVAGEGCINNAGGMTRGILELEDPIHARNYGACMCARRADLIAIGGADEHIDYLGHICGPYDMTFRLFNHGRKEIWHRSEFMYHTWHPGQAGADNYLGPHDGRHVSSTAIEALTSRRVMPLVENEAIRRLRESGSPDDATAANEIIRPRNLELWRRENLEKPFSAALAEGAESRPHYYKGFKIRREGARLRARLLAEPDADTEPARGPRLETSGLAEMREAIDRTLPLPVVLMLACGRAYLFGRLALGYLLWRIPRRLLGIGVPPRVADGRPQPASGGAARARGVLARLRDRYAQYAREAGWLADSLADIVPNLFYLSRARGDAGRAMPVLLVESYRFGPYIRFLMALRAIPEVKIEWVHNSAQLQEFFARHDGDRARLQPIIARSIYVRYYPLFAASHSARALTVV